MTSLKDTFDELQFALKQEGAAMGASELHGVLTAHAAKSGYDEFGAQLAINAWLDIESPSADLRQRVKTMAEATRDQVAPYAEYDLAIVLPSEDAPLNEQLFELTCWCAGFLSGLGETEGLIEQLKQTEVGELVDDLLMIARTGSEIADGEENERDFVEVLEFVRIAALNIAAELFELKQARVIKH